MQQVSSNNTEKKGVLKFQAPKGFQPSQPFGQFEPGLYAAVITEVQASYKGDGAVHVAFSLSQDGGFGQKFNRLFRITPDAVGKRDDASEIAERELHEFYTMALAAGVKVEQGFEPSDLVKKSLQVGLDWTPGGFVSTAQGAFWKAGAEVEWQPRDEGSSQRGRNQRRRL